VLERARRAGGAGVVVGTVPSAVAWRLLRERRVTAVVPAREAERRARPRVQVVTGQDQPKARLLRESLAALRAATEAGHYGVLLAARRGEGRALVCRRCGERRSCPTCASSLGVPESGAALLCEGCGWSARRVPACAVCGEREVVPLAAGAVRLGHELQRTFEVPVVVLEGYARQAPPPPAVLVMTRGSVLDAPPGIVGAVVLPDLDGSLRRPSLDAAEDTLRLACTLAGWTVHGRRDPEHSRVVVQTREPEHHAIAALAAWDPGGFWRVEVGVRAPLRFPPLANAMRIEIGRVDGDATALLRAALADGDELLGPLPVEGRAGYLLKSDDREATLAALRPLRESWSKAGVEVRVDVDPVDAL
jgi:primosomal protein N' (replication factor Y) (superfamily II helicase)